MYEEGRDKYSRSKGVKYERRILWSAQAPSSKPPTRGGKQFAWWVRESTCNQQKKKLLFTRLAKKVQSQSVEVCIPTSLSPPLLCHWKIECATLYVSLCHVERERRGKERGGYEIRIVG
jgi:hypothetical protein